MTRTKPPERMHSVTRHVECVLENNHVIKPLATFSITPEGRVCAVFCADFKTGTTMYTLIMDACVLLSRLLQHGVPPREIADTLAKPKSLLGELAVAAADINDENIAYDPRTFVMRPRPTDEVNQ